MKKKVKKAVSALSAAAVLASQCVTAAYADGFSFDEAVNLGECDYYEDTVFTEDIDAAYDEAFTEIPAGTVMGGISVPKQLELSEEETAVLVEQINANMDNLRASAAEDIVTETLDASYDYTSDLYYAQLPASYQTVYSQMITDFDTILNSSKDVSVQTVTYSGEKYNLFYSVPYTDIDQISALFYAFIYSNPQYFFTDTVLFGTSGGKNYMFFNMYNDFNSGSVRSAAKSKIDAVADNWMKSINACPDALSKECKIAQLICENSKYHLDSNGDIVSSKANQTIYGCLVDKMCVCAGFSKTFTYFCHMVGIPCTGIVSADHAWNYVKLNGKWYETCITGMNQRYTAYYDYNYTFYGALNRGSNVLYKLYNNSSSFVPEDCMKEYFTLPSCSYDMPLNFYTRVDVSTPGQAMVAWRNVYGASQYAIYSYNNGKYSRAGIVNAPSVDTKYSYYTIKNMTGGKTYGFVVKALFSDPVNETNVWTGVTSGNMVYGKVTVAKPKITKCDAANGQAAINWTKVDGATQYAVYTYRNSKWTLAGKTTALGKYVNNLTNGLKYGFAVKAYVNGAWTDVTSTDIVYATPVAKPKITLCEGRNGQVAVNWTSVEGAVQYAVYYKSSGSWVCAGKTTALGKFVNNLSNGTQYGFAVKAYVNGAWTNITSADIVYATPTADKSDVIKADFLDGFFDDDITIDFAA